MLTLTDSAVTAIRNLTSQPELPDETGLRIMSQEQGGPAFQVTLAESPVDGDQVIETEGARVFLEPVAAVALDDKVAGRAGGRRGNCRVHTRRAGRLSIPRRARSLPPPR